LLNFKKLKEIRERSGLSQTDLAKKIGVTPSHFSNIEKGKRGISTETLSAVLQVLGVKIEDVWDNGSGDIPILPTQNNGVVIERTKIILPPTEDTYRLVGEQITGKRDIDPNLATLIEKWCSAANEKKDKIMEMLNESSN
jgi:transcriptional regulator with XRE-family HTH domain